MVWDNLRTLEQKTEKRIADEKKKIRAIRSIRELLNQVDLSVEVLPIEDRKKMLQLLNALKGEKLTAEEKRIIKIL